MVITLIMNVNQDYLFLLGIIEKLSVVTHICFTWYNMVKYLLVEDEDI